MAVRRWQKSRRRIYVRPRTGPQSAHLWWPAVAKLQAASMPVAQAAAPRDRQTDGSRYSEMPLGRGITMKSDIKVNIVYGIIADKSTRHSISAAEIITVHRPWFKQCMGWHVRDCVRQATWRVGRICVCPSDVIHRAYTVRNMHSLCSDHIRPPVWKRAAAVCIDFQRCN